MKILAALFGHMDIIISPQTSRVHKLTKFAFRVCPLKKVFINIVLGKVGNRSEKFEVTEK